MKEKKPVVEYLEWEYFTEACFDLGIFDKMTTDDGDKITLEYLRKIISQKFIMC